MRLYTFINFYLSSIQQGIQTAHCVSNLFVEWNNPKFPEYTKLHDWAENHKTIITLNGGPNAGIHATYAELERLGADLQLPYTIFYEDEMSLGGIATSCGIVVPEHIYDAREPNIDAGDDDVLMRELDMWSRSPEGQLYQLLRSHSLAR